MKSILFLILFSVSFAASADETFDLGMAQPENHPYEIDDLDASIQADPNGAFSKAADRNDAVMNIEVNQSAPSLLTPDQAMTPAEKLALENQRRQKAIRKELTEGASLVKTCIARNNKNFRGTHVKLRWTVSPQGNVQEAKIVSTDIGDLAIRDCIKRAARRFDFSDAGGDHFKKSIVEYTFKFTNKNAKPGINKAAHAPSAEMSWR